MNQIITSNKKPIRLILSGFLSNFFEFYDFALFGTFAIPLAKAFFPDDQFSSILKTLSVFGIAFFARPVGAFYFGYLGDTKGRKHALMLSILLMGISTFLIGCLPTYETIGNIAPLLLIICRLLQGFSLGGESNGAFIFLLEHIKYNKGVIGALVLASGSTGVIFATLQGVIFTQSNMPEWAWRIPFWLGLIMAVIGFYIRSALAESTEFVQHNTGSTTFIQQLKILLKHIPSCLCTIGIGGVNSVFVYTLTIYLNIYLNQFAEYSVSSSLLYSHTGLIVCLFLLPIMGYIADKLSYQRVMKYACVIGLLGSFLIPYFLDMKLFIIAMINLALVISAFNGPTPAFVNNLFPTNIRYTGVSVNFAIGTAVFGAFCPLLFTFMTGYFNSIFALVPCLFLISIIGLISVIAGIKYNIQNTM